MRILKRKIGKKFFFYLQHSFREKNKAITKEKYLGKKINQNHLKKMKEEMKKEYETELLRKIEQIKTNFQKEWNRIPETIRDKELEQISIEFTYNTNAIEGSTITLEETIEIIKDKIAPNKPLRDIQETEAHSRIFLEALNKKEEITKELILKWHKEIFSITKPDLAGKFRDFQVRVGNHRAPDWQDLNELMAELITFLNQKNNLNILEFVAKAHYKFEYIHPFGDGNGRIGRILMNFLLWHKGYPLLIIEYKKRASYYRAFKDEESFVKYFIRRYLSTHKKLIKAKL